MLTFGRRAATALRDRIEARIAAGGRRATMPSRWCGPSRRTPSACCGGPPPSAGEPAPRLLTGPEQDAVIREHAGRAPERRRPALAGVAAAGAAHPGVRRRAARPAAAGGRAGHRAARRWPSWADATGRPDWVAAARFLREYVAVLALRDATTRGSVAYDQAELVRAASRAAASTTRSCSPPSGTGCRYVYVDELADTDPAQIDLLGLIAGGGAHLVAFADPDSSTFALPGRATRPGCATSPSGSGRPPGRRRRR